MASRKSPHPELGAKRHVEGRTPSIPVNLAYPWMNDNRRALILSLRVAHRPWGAPLREGGAHRDAMGG